MAYADEPPVGIARRRWVIVVTAIVLVAAAAAAVVTWIPFTSDRLRAKVVSTLEERLEADVELKGLSLRIFPRLHAAGRGLSVRHRGRTDVPPLISVDEVVVDADLIGLWRRHIAHLKLEGLKIQIPPGDDDDEDATSRQADKE